MYRDSVMKLAKENITQAEASKNIGIGRTTLWRLKCDKQITTNNFCKIVSWLDNGVLKYIIND